VRVRDSNQLFFSQLDTGYPTVAFELSKSILAGCSSFTFSLSPDLSYIYAACVYRCDEDDRVTMSASLPGNRELPESQYDLTTYWGRVRQTAGITDPR
jgi:hypothetical protein